MSLDANRPLLNVACHLNSLFKGIVTQPDFFIVFEIDFAFFRACFNFCAKDALENSIDELVEKWRTTRLLVSRRCPECSDSAAFWGLWSSNNKKKLKVMKKINFFV